LFVWKSIKKKSMLFQGINSKTNIKNSESITKKKSMLFQGITSKINTKNSARLGTIHRALVADGTLDTARAILQAAIKNKILEVAKTFGTIHIDDLYAEFAGAIGGGRVR
jgi:hypothetical protein